MTTTMISKVSEYCTDLLTTSKCKELPFHNLQHTKEVVQNVKYLCAAMHISEQETEILVVAAWFQDTGFSKTYKSHEDESIVIPNRLLNKKEVNRDFIDKICNYIDVTKIPQYPTNKQAEVLCDANIFHISNSHFFYRKLLLRREWEVFCNHKATGFEWYKLNLEFSKSHHFRSVYGIKILEQGKQENINKVEQILKYYDC